MIKNGTDKQPSQQTVKGSESESKTNDNEITIHRKRFSKRTKTDSTPLLNTHQPPPSPQSKREPTRSKIIKLPLESPQMPK